MLEVNNVGERNMRGWYLQKAHNTLFHLISVGHHLELRIAMIFY